MPKDIGKDQHVVVLRDIGENDLIVK